MSKIKLKNCPFCGKELIINKGYYAHELSLTEPIECYAATWVFRVDDEKSIELWNTRKPMDNAIESIGNQITQNETNDKEVAYWNNALRTSIRILKECAE